MGSLRATVMAVLLLANSAAAAPIWSARLRVNDLVYDPVTKRIYASVVESPSVRRRGLAALDLETGKVTFPWTTAGEPGKLAIAPQGRYLYVAIDGGASVLRFDTVNQAAGLQFTPGAGTGANAVDDMAVVPGHPESVVLSLAQNTQQPGRAVERRGMGVYVFDNGVPRLSFARGGGQLAVLDSTNRLYGYSHEAPDSGFRRMTVDASGVTLDDVTVGLISGAGVEIRYDQGLLFTSTGRVISPEARVLLGTFSGLGAGAPLAADARDGRVYYLTGGGPIAKLLAFDPRTFLRVGSWEIPGINGEVGRLIRWGQERSDGGGLAFRTSDGQIFVIHLDQLDHHPVDFHLSTDLDPFRPPVGGRSFTMRVTLTAPAPVGGATLQLSSSNPTSVSLPPSVTIPTGEVSASFQVSTHAVAVPTEVTLTIRSPDVTRTVTFRFSPPGLAFITTNPKRAEGDAIVIGTVGLNGPAPVGGVTVQLSGVEGLPATVTVPEGATSVSFPITVHGRAASYEVQILASLPGGPPGVAVSTSLRIGPAAPVLSAAVYNPANGHWYQEARVPGTGISWEEARVAAQRLTHRGYPGHLATITSAAENQFIHTQVPYAHDPGLLHWLGGSEPIWHWITGEPWSYTSFYDNEPRFISPGLAGLALSWDGRWRAIEETGGLHGFIVEYEPAIASPPRPQPASILARLLLFPNPVSGGQLAQGQILFSQPAGGGLGVTFTSSDPAVAVVAPFQSVLPGEGVKSFVISTQPVRVSTSVTITASTPEGSVSATLVVAPEPAPLAPVPPTSAPAAPTGLAATQVGADRVTLTWKDNSSDEAVFVLYRQEPGREWVKLGDAPRNSTRYTDQGLRPSTTYHYFVLAWNPRGGASRRSNEVTVTTLPAQ